VNFEIFALTYDLLRVFERFSAFAVAILGQIRVEISDKCLDGSFFFENSLF